MSYPGLNGPTSIMCISVYSMGKQLRWSRLEYYSENTFANLDTKDGLLEMMQHGVY